MELDDNVAHASGDGYHVEVGCTANISELLAVFIFRLQHEYRANRDLETKGSTLQISKLKTGCNLEPFPSTSQPTSLSSILMLSFLIFKVAIFQGVSPTIILYVFPVSLIYTQPIKAS
jgi:hypothetical protein